MGDFFITIPIEAAVRVASLRDTPRTANPHAVEQDFDFGAHVAAHTKTAISLPELVRQTNAFSKKYRPGCTPKLLDSNPKALFLHYNVKCNKEDSDPAGHDVRVQFDVTKVQESQQAKDLDVQVQCSCPAFLYWGAQWNLHQRDGLLGTPRPKLVAPTERLDLRGNFVICKHIHAVFERILPSVQHNIVKILREREVRKNKEKVRKTPEKLKQRQEEMWKRKQLEKIRKIKDKKIRDKMLQSLEDEEKARLMHEQQLMNQGEVPGEVEREEPALAPEEKAVVESPELAPQAPAGEPEEESVSAIQDLLQQEEGKIEEAHKEGLPHIHKGLPYDIPDEDEEDEKIMRKFESLTLDRVAIPPKRGAHPNDLKKGAQVRDYLGLHGNPQEVGTVLELQLNKQRPYDSRAKVQFSDGVGEFYAWQLMLKNHQSTFGFDYMETK